MRVTIQQIADEAGVSRGTVDRALHNRGRIDSGTAERILKLAEEMGYEVKKRKRKEEGKRKIKIGVITLLSKASFMMEINRGIEIAARELANLGVELIIKKGSYVSEEEQLASINELLDMGIDGLAIMPVECEEVRSKLISLSDENNIPIVTFNSDIVGTKRISYVGMDNCQSGKTAAGLMGMLTGGTGKILIVTGYFTNNVNNQRVEGFIEEIRQNFPGLEIAGVQGGFDQTDEVEQIIVNTLTEISGIKGILVVSGGEAGVRSAFEKLNIQDRPYVILYDQTPKNEKLLRDDVADFLIDQNGYVQGYRPPHILADLLLSGIQPGQELWHTDISIKTKYNL